MSIELIKYRQPLNKDELTFLQRKEEKERKQLYKIIRVFMLLSFICAFIVAIVKAIIGDPDPFSMKSYFGGVLYLMGFSGVGIFWSYYNNLRKVQQDIKHKTKTVERTFITRKQYMPLNNEYYFFLSSAIKLSIEVSEVDYRRFNDGDEINIEYTTYSNFFLGYF